MKTTQNSISTTVREDTVTITIRGKFTFDTYKSFFDAYANHRNRRHDFILDFSGVDYVDSAGLGMLMKFKEEIPDKTCRITLRGCNKNLRKILSVTRLDEIFNVP